MARPLRIEFAGATYHAMSRGNARQKIFRDQRDYGRFLEGLEAVVEKFGFEFFSFVLMPNHTHLFFRTPRPNLSRGMQYLLSGYANWFNTRHRRPGHLFQGRFKGELVEDETYFGNVSRYLHLNPVRGKRPLVKKPEEWAWSSYPGYRWNRQRVDWIDYDAVLNAWQGGRGGKDAAAAYRRFVEAGLKDPPANPLSAAVEGWMLGSADFVDRIKEKLQSPNHLDEVPTARRLAAPTTAEVLEAVAKEFGADAASFAVKHNKQASRAVAAWLARRLTLDTLRELAGPFGMTHPDSLRGLLNRAEQALEESPELRRQAERARRRLQRPVLRKNPKKRV